MWELEKKSNFTKTISRANSVMGYTVYKREYSFSTKKFTYKTKTF